MPSRKSIKVTVTTLSGERVDVDIAPGNTAQDIIAALIQGDKLPAEDSFGNAMQYELVSDATMLLLAGDKPLLDQGVQDGAELRVKPGARVAAEPVSW
jgi:uncharacterized ubiquitin-like protein YukD